MLLQYPVQFHLFRDHGRLNPEVPLEDAGDCGANTLFLLGLIGQEAATALSIQQNICWITKRGKEFTPRYLFKKYLFTDDSKQYEVIECSKKELMIEVQELTPGYGTFLYMEDDTHFGHFTCIYKNEETGEIEIADLQTEEIIKNENYDPTRLDDYLSQYELFYIPSTVRRSIVDSPVRQKPSRQTSESPLMYSHGSPAKTIPSLVKYGDSENVDGYRSPEKVTRSPAKTVRSPLSPLRDPKRNRIGGKRKRKSRRKN